MKANDLRIDNWIKYEDKLVQVVQLSSLMILCQRDENQFLVNHEPEIFQPIELTEELLLKIGFDAMHSCRYMYEKSIINKHNKKVVVYITFHMINKTLRIDFSNDLQVLNLYDIQYLHQLQNAYYCLTGKELKVEL